MRGRREYFLPLHHESHNRALIIPSQMKVAVHETDFSLTTTKRGPIASLNLVKETSELDSDLI